MEFTLIMEERILPSDASSRFYLEPCAFKSDLAASGFLRLEEPRRWIRFQDHPLPFDLPFLYFFSKYPCAFYHEYAHRNIPVGTFPYGLVPSFE
jgi:hypothetical protein